MEVAALGRAQPRTQNLRALLSFHLTPGPFCLTLSLRTHDNRCKDKVRASRKRRFVHLARLSAQLTDLSGSFQWSFLIFNAVHASFKWSLTHDELCLFDNPYDHFDFVPILLFGPRSGDHRHALPSLDRTQILPDALWCKVTNDLIRGIT